MKKNIMILSTVFALTTITTLGIYANSETVDNFGLKKEFKRVKSTCYLSDGTTVVSVGNECFAGAAYCLPNPCKLANQQ